MGFLRVWLKTQAITWKQTRARILEWKNTASRSNGRISFLWSDRMTPLRKWHWELAGDARSYHIIWYYMLSPALGYALSYAFTPFLQPANQRQISSFLPFKRRQDAVTLRVHANVRASELETKARDKFLRFFSLCSVTAFLSGWCHFRRLKTMMCSNRVPRWRNLFQSKKSVEGVMLWIKSLRT